MWEREAPQSIIQNQKITFHQQVLTSHSYGFLGHVKPQSINHNKYNMVIVDEYSRKMENLNEVRVKELRSDNGIELKNHKLEEFCDGKGISQNFSSPCTPEQNGVVERRNKTLIEAARTMLNEEDLLIATTFMFLDTLCSFTTIESTWESLINDFFLGYSLVAKAFRVFNIRRQEMEETYHVTFNEADEVFTQTSTEGVYDSPIHNEPNDYELVEIQNDIFEAHNISNDVNLASVAEPTTTLISPSTKISHDTPAPQDKSRECLYVNFLSEIELKKVIKALEKEGWVIAMQKELNQFKRNKVWTLVPTPHGKTIIRTKWIFKNKMDENVARLEAIRIFLAYVAYMSFVVYQMDVKSTFLNEKLSKEVYVQPQPGFESSEFPNYVCKQDKSLYELKQTSKACYQDNAKESHLVAVKRFFKYVKGTSNLDRKSTSRGCQIIGGKLVCWSAKKQSLVAMSSVEAEYVAVAGCCAQLLYIKSQLADYDILYDKVSLHQGSYFKSENYVSIPPKETVRAELATLGLIVEKNLDLSSIDLVNSSPLKGPDVDIDNILFSSLVAKLVNSKKGREPNVCYTRYLSLIIEHLIGKDYKKDKLKNFKPHHISATSFKTPSTSEIALIPHMLKVAKLQLTTVQPVDQPKASTDKRSKKKKILSFSEPKTSKNVTQFNTKKAVTDTQHVEELTPIADATKSLEASKSEAVEDPLAIDSRIKSLGNVNLDDLLKDQKVNEEAKKSPFDIESEIKFIRKANMDQEMDDVADITLIRDSRAN
ncbi:retrovirus-related pol polyprotein from transposon TNT 1-94 [Tanacetum coccineum]